MNIPLKSNSSGNRNVNEEKTREREAWQKLAIKVIVWKDGMTNGRIAEKISHKDWAFYSKKILATNLISGKIKMTADLKETWEKISNHGGFE